MRRVKIKNMYSNSYCKDVGQLELSWMAGGSANWNNHFLKWFDIIHLSFTYILTSNFTARYKPSICATKPSIIPKSQKFETTQICINSRLCKCSIFIQWSTTQQSKWTTASQIIDVSPKQHWMKKIPNLDFEQVN